jgi:FtsP/CotA-like multicopper oxidase with cupredoxin domain
MNAMRNRNRRWLGVTLTAAALLVLAPIADAAIDGISDPTPGSASFDFTAKEGYVTTPDGGSIYCWGYSDDGESFGGVMQYPGPTLILNQGDTVTITLTSEIPDLSTPAEDYFPVSIIFPGFSASAAGGSAGAITQESTGPLDTVTYTFTADSPGTYLYHSGTDPKLQVEMGLLGVIVVRPSAVPTGGAPGTTAAEYAYDHKDSYFGHEYLFLHTEMDPRVHQYYEFGQPAGMEWDNTDWWPVYWFFNGRAAPDDLLASYATWLPHQPYNLIPRGHPGDKILMRVVGGGRESHPFHHHGDHALLIARDGQLLDGDSLTPELDLAYEEFTILVNPGQTVDAIFDWTGEKMGWDIYGTVASGMPPHDCLDAYNNVTGVLGSDGYADTEAQGCNPLAATPCYPYEWCADHGKEIPVLLPETQNLAFGAWWSGSPYLGTGGALPPGEGGLNPNSAYPFMWHSHTEKELTNNDIYPGGLLTMFFLEPHGVPID